MKSYIKCVNVDFESSRIEEFNGRVLCFAHEAKRITCLVRYPTEREGHEEPV